jgi:hypothetical protein
MSNCWVTVAWFDRIQDALIARSVLESAGIDCWIKNAEAVRIRGGRSLPHEGLQLQVLDSDAEVAHQLLQPPAEGTTEVET